MQSAPNAVQDTVSRALSGNYKRRDTAAALVSSIAERLVREEIDRLKAAIGKL